MRNPFRRFRRNRAPVPVGTGNAGGHYRSAAYRPLSPGQVRERQFARVRRGVDATEVELFLRRVADDLAALHAELGRTRDENIRIKRALRDWQSRFTPGVRA
ncbi:DivIVA domain-containing protein [Micromonospora sp. NPDC126480]|uniref:DivIVA domain-containing protein n=1 Tax=Micromonospora sp. NPDC126480 TaxID=3155312 RepID=UPI003325D5ED